MAEDEITLAELSAVLDETTLTRSDKDYVLRCQWTQSEIPEISSAEQYEAYAKWQNEIDARLAAAGLSPVDEAWARSQDGVLSTSIGARMIEWEERQP